MNNHSDAICIRHCLALIEERWQRGPSGEWNSYDFEKLSDEILDVTAVSLSISTLKRLFGKVTYNNLPSVYTLNTLARYIGFEDWNSFKRKEFVNPILSPGLDATAQINRPQTAPVILTAERVEIVADKKFSWWFLLLLPLGAMAYLLISSAGISSHRRVNPASFSFSSNKVLTEGVPNSVVFHYDASAAQTDSIFIVQTWDMKRRTLVSKTGHEHSAIYYYPGYFNAKLVIDTETVRTHGLMISSGGWLAMAENEPSPFYFKKEEFINREGGISVDSELLAKKHFPFYPQAPWISIYYIKDMGPLPDDNFNFESTLRSLPIGGSDGCNRVEVLIQCKNDVFIFELSKPACIGNLELYAQGKRVTSKQADLSGFGADLTHWTKLRLETINKHMQFIINNKLAYSLDFPNPTTDIVGVQFRFHGGGAVRDTRFISSGRTIDLK